MLWAAAVFNSQVLPPGCRSAAAQGAAARGRQTQCACHCRCLHAIARATYCHSLPACHHPLFGSFRLCPRLPDTLPCPISRTCRRPAPPAVLAVQLQPSSKPACSLMHRTSVLPAASERLWYVTPGSRCLRQAAAACTAGQAATPSALRAPMHACRHLHMQPLDCGMVVCQSNGGV